MNMINGNSHMTKLYNAFKQSRSCEEFVTIVSQSWWWYLDQPEMKTWTKDSLRSLYGKWCPPVLGVKLEFTRY